MIITISGYPGSGKSTAGKMLAKKLRYKFYSIGAIRRAMAKERGMTLQEFNVHGEKHAFTDRDVDEWQRKLGQTTDKLVIEGRTSFHFIPHSIKIFFSIDLGEAAKRIFNDPAHTRRFEASHHYTTVKQLEHGLRGRIASDTRRYKKYYGLNIFKKNNYNLIVDTTKLTPEQTFSKVTGYLAKSSIKKESGDKQGVKTRVVHKPKKVQISKSKTQIGAKVRIKSNKKF